MSKRIYRSNSNKMISGVCGGLGEYFDIDPTLVRLGFLLLACAGGSSLLIYIICAIVIPVAPSGGQSYRPQPDVHTAPERQSAPEAPKAETPSEPSSESATKINLEKKGDNA